MITGTVGKLGRGKTLSGVIEAYSNHYEGETVYSNLWLNFPHVPIRTPYDFLEIKDGFFLADELWHLADCRKSMSLLNDVITIILLRSRKRHFHVFYTQQYVQVDVRINYITDRWIEPKCLPKPPTDPKLLKNYVPQLLLQNIMEDDGHTLPPRIIDPRPYLKLYDTDRDPYTLSAVVTSKKLKEILDRALKQTPNVKTEFETLTKKGVTG